MHAEELSWNPTKGWSGGENASDAPLVLYFGSRELIGGDGWFAPLRERFPKAHILGCSSASLIAGKEIIEDAIAGVAVKFDRARLRAEWTRIEDSSQSRTRGEELGALLAAPDLAGVILLSDGLLVNGSELVKGITSKLPAHVPVSGGLAADGPLFSSTLVGLDQPPVSGAIAALGFYGPGVSLRTGSAGGWAEFGPWRRVTRSEGNRLYALDDEPALNLYDRYLTPEEIRELPSSALLFPLKIFDPDIPEHNIVRTVLAVDRNDGSMTFAGDIPQGWVAQLMRGNIDRLTQGAADAARQVCVNGETPAADALILMVSCIGRRLLMGQRTIDEVDAINAELGPDPVRIGFYSYGEICPHDLSGRGEMHNQTMTITAISEHA